MLLFSDKSVFAHDQTDPLMRLNRTEGEKVVVLLPDGRDEMQTGGHTNGALIILVPVGVPIVVGVILFGGPTTRL